MSRNGPQTDLAGPYLDLLERALTHTLYQPIDNAGPTRIRITRQLRESLRRHGIGATWAKSGATELREEGRDLPLFAHTMVGAKRLHHLRRSIEELLDEGIQGDLIEAGIWRGGASIMMRGVLRAHGVTDRTVWVADSFDGLPRPRREHPADAGLRYHKERHLVVPRSEVEQNFQRYGLLDRQVRFVEGLFHETLPSLPPDRWALIRVDGDLYGSTMDALTSLYPNLSPGGYVIIDDYGALKECRRAVEDFRRIEGIAEPIQEIDWTGVFWRRGQ